SAIELNPGDVECWYEYAETLYENGRFPDSLVAFESAISLEPDWSESHYGRAKSLLAMKRFAEMTYALRDAIRLDPRMRDEFNDEFPEVAALQEVRQALLDQ